MVEWDYLQDSAGLMKEVKEMRKSEGGKTCEHPERLKGKPGECSPEQIKECHGQDVEHPCVKGK